MDAKTAKKVAEGRKGKRRTPNPNPKPPKKPDAIVYVWTDESGKLQVKTEYPK